MFAWAVNSQRRSTVAEWAHNTAYHKLCVSRVLWSNDDTTFGW